MEKNYKELKEKHQKEVNSLPIYWAFGIKQEKELFKKLNIKDNEDLKNKCFGIFGGIAFKKDKEMILNTFKKHDEELKRAMENDEFLQSAFRYELSNHEYIVTYDISDTLEALRISEKEFAESERIQKAFKLAKADYIKAMEDFGW